MGKKSLRKKKSHILTGIHSIQITKKVFKILMLQEFYVHFIFKQNKNMKLTQFTFFFVFNNNQDKNPFKLK